MVENRGEDFAICIRYQRNIIQHLPVPAFPICSCFLLGETIVDGLGNPVEFMLSAGNDHDSVHAVELLEKVEISGSTLRTIQRIPLSMFRSSFRGRPRFPVFFAGSSFFMRQREGKKQRIRQLGEPEAG